MRADERRFRLLSRLLPASFRDDYDAEMRRVFRSERDQAAGAGGRLGAGFWMRTVLGIVAVAIRGHLDDLRLDLRYALRAMVRQPLFTLTAALSLAVGIAGATTVFAVFDATFLRPIPGVAEQDRLVNVKPVSAIDESFGLSSYPNYVDLRDGNSTLQGLAGFNGLGMSLRLGPAGEAEETPTQVVTGNFFDVLGARPAEGRFFLAEEDRTGTPAVVISSHLRQQRLGHEPEVLGREIFLNGTAFTIIGVAPPGFRGHFTGFNFDLFVSSSMAKLAGLPSRDERAADWVEMVGRLRDGVTLQEAAADLDVLARQIATAHPEINRGMSIDLEKTTGIDADLRGGLLALLVILFGVCSFVLLIGCVNVANMLLGRVIGRRRELAVRQALGAPRSRLARQLLTENLLLALLAGGLGAGLSLAAARAARAAVPSFGGLVSLDIRLSPATLGAALAVSLITALLFGTAPALAAARGGVAATLKAGTSRLAGRSRLRGALVVAQVSLSVVVLSCAGLFLRALGHAATIDPGFDPRGVYSVGLNPALMGMTSEQGLLRGLLERVRQHPGTESACLVSRVPLSLGSRFFPNPAVLEIPGRDPPPDQEGFPVEHSLVSDGYFRTLGIRIRRGRGFEAADRAGSRPVAVVNETFARRFHPGGDAVGAMFRHDDGDVEIVGVAQDSRYRTPEEEPMAFVYFPFAQRSRSRGTLLARAGPGAGGYARELRVALRQAAPELPLRDLAPMEESLASLRTPQRVAGGAAAGLGLVGLFLTAVGLYGVLGYTVNSRASEIGLRLSLGARPRDVMNMILRQGLWLVGIGMGIGVPLSLLAGRALQSFLFGLSPIDPLTYLSLGTLFLLTGLLACAVPAGRAARIDPLTVLRAE